MLQQSEPVSLHDGVVTGTADAPELVGSRCRRCGVVAFPRQASCAACTSSDVEERRLARRGTLWTWTIQCFAPKSPPYDGPVDFAPFPLGYVELTGEVKVETRLVDVTPDQLRIGMPMELVLIPAPGADDTMTYAFRPIEDEA